MDNIQIIIKLYENNDTQNESDLIDKTDLLDKTDLIHENEIKDNTEKFINKFKCKKNNSSVIFKTFNKNTKIKDILSSLEIEDSYLLFCGKILNEDETLDDYGIQNYDLIFENKRIKGGIFSTIVRALVKVVEFFILILTYLDDFIMIFVKLVELIPLIFNPKKFIDDILFGVTYAIKLVVGGMMDSMGSGTESNKGDEVPDNVPKVCLPPTLFNLFLLIICPPLALMIHLGSGLQGIFLVVVCAILTVWCYYFPGLIYAALHILC